MPKEFIGPPSKEDICQTNEIMGKALVEVMEGKSNGQDTPATQQETSSPDQSNSK